VSAAAGPVFPYDADRVIAENTPLAAVTVIGETAARIRDTADTGVAFIARPGRLGVASGSDHM
jgi:hypothetical protein